MPKKIFDRKLILECAVKMAKSVGLEKLSMRNLATELNCSVMPIYDAFESKDGLVEAVFDEIINENNSSNSYFLRNKEILLNGIRHPLLYRDIRNQGKKSLKFSRYYQDVISLMKNEERLKRFSDTELESLNFDILVYISGLVERSILETVEFDENQYLRTLEQITELFILGYTAAKNIN